MKKILTIIVLQTTFLFAVSPLYAQSDPPHPNYGNNPGGGSTPVGGGAPIGEGLILLVGLGVAYGGKKIYNYKKRKLVG
ncbi:MAG: hypothetical protein B6D64_05970 [Bacteroidetes bacterium 4484_276]|nr:MAG: hypothetical protein B6D64_05970 [Bacteroidetes bacterium 4484_276]OYT13438.1 MAG: hypothetical protein B6I19_05170 [Bacteroidetes bacterium 4572_114]